MQGKTWAAVFCYCLVMKSLRLAKRKSFSAAFTILITKLVYSCAFN